MLEALKLITEMGAPAAFAFIGVAAAFTVPITVIVVSRRAIQRSLEIERVRAKTSVELAQSKNALTKLPSSERDY